MRDRLLVAALLGTGPLAYYALCNQLTQPIHALMASAFNFIFPNFSAQSASGRWSETSSRYRHASSVAAAFVIAFCVTMIVGARLILRLWLGAAVAAQYHDLLVAMAIGNSLLALSVVPHYAALALGRARALVIVNFVAGVLSLGCGYFLIRHIGLMGAGSRRSSQELCFFSLFGIVRESMHLGNNCRSATKSTLRPTTCLDFAQ